MEFRPLYHLRTFVILVTPALPLSHPISMILNRQQSYSSVSYHTETFVGDDSLC